MNKNRGIWLVIVAILIIGIAVTFATSRFIRQNGGSLDTVAVTQMPGTTAGGGMPQAYTEGAGTELPAAARKRMEETVPAGEEGAVSGNTDEAAAGAAVPEPASSRMMAAEGAAVPAPESIQMDESKEAADEAVPEAAAAGQKHETFKTAMKSIIKSSPFDRAMKVEAELNKLHGRIIKLLDSIKAYETEDRRLNLAEKQYNLQKQKLTGEFEIDPETGEIDDEAEEAEEKL